MTDPVQILAAAKRVVVVDWPSRDVPAALAHAGFECLVKSGPAPEDYTAYSLRDGTLATYGVNRSSRADLVYAHRPLSEIGAIVELATQFGSSAIWIQSGRSSAGVPDPRGCWIAGDESETARGIVESAGLIYIDHVYIADVARSLGRPSS